VRIKTVKKILATIIIMLPLYISATSSKLTNAEKCILETMKSKPIKRNHCRNSSCIRQQYYNRITRLQEMLPNKITHNNAPDGIFKVNQVTWGACMTICEDTSFCKSADHNSNSGVCTLYLNSHHPQYLKLQHTCQKKYWHAVYRNEKWNIVCAF